MWRSETKVKGERSSRDRVKRSDMALSTDKASVRFNIKQPKSLSSWPSFAKAKASNNVPNIRS